jgi:hypothetical protein
MTADEAIRRIDDGGQSVSVSLQDLTDAEARTRLAFAVLEEVEAIVDAAGRDRDMECYADWILSRAAARLEEDTDDEDDR